MHRLQYIAQPRSLLLSRWPVMLQMTVRATRPTLIGAGESKFMRIDVHSHLVSEPYVNALRGLFANDQTPIGQDVQRLIHWMSTDPRMTKLDLRVEEMDRYGIDMQVLS